MRNLVVVICAASVMNASYGFAQELLVEGFESLDGWKTGGQKEISFDLSSECVKAGKHSLCLHVEIDHKHAEDVEEVKYPMGWPSVTKLYKPGIDLSEYDFLELDVYFESRRGVDPDFALNITLRDSDGKGIYGTTFIDLRHSKWAHEKLCIRDVPTAKDFANLHFFLSESVYDHGDVIDFYIDNLQATKATDYQPPEVGPVRHAVAESGSAVLWMEGPCRKIMRTEEADLSKDADPVVRMSAARNETEAVQLVLSWGALYQPGKGALESAILEEVGVRHLRYSIPLLKEMRDGEPTHDGSNRRDPYAPQDPQVEPEDR